MAAPTSPNPVKQLQQSVVALQQRVATLEGGRPGRKTKPLIAIRQRDVCAIEPDSDSAACPFASIYRYQKGCHGASCRLKQHEAYERRRPARAKAPLKAVRVPKKAVSKKEPVKTAAKAAPAPRSAKRVTKATAKKLPLKQVSKRLAS